MSLREQLEARRSTAKDRFPTEDLSVMRRATEDLRDSDIPNRALRIGDSAPIWQLPTSHGAVLHSRELLMKGPLVLTFFRGVW
jgi:hypothetical protein